MTHTSLTLNGTRYSLDHEGEIPAALHPFAPFLTAWLSADETFSLHTSGSTGTPKVIRAAKAHMRASARRTCRVFGLGRGSTALLALPMRYVAGQMMMVRALVSDLALWAVEPSARPLRDVPDEVLRQGIDFAPLVPNQLYETLRNDDDRERLRYVRCVLLGGGKLSGTLEEMIRDFGTSAPDVRIVMGYGMTETLSHIALREVVGAGRDEAYTPFPEVKLRLSERGTLQINDPVTMGDTPTFLTTNDLATLHPDGRFSILGRADNIISSAGLKIALETVEDRLAALLREGAFALTAKPDPRYGEALTLVVTPAATALSDETLREAMHALFVDCPAYVPRHIVRVASLPLTPGGKIARAALRALVAEG